MNCRYTCQTNDPLLNFLNLWHRTLNIITSISYYINNGTGPVPTDSNPKIRRLLRRPLGPWIRNFDQLPLIWLSAKPVGVLLFHFQSSQQHQPRPLTTCYFHFIRRANNTPPATKFRRPAILFYSPTSQIFIIIINRKCMQVARKQVVICLFVFFFGGFPASSSSGPQKVVPQTNESAAHEHGTAFRRELIPQSNTTLCNNNSKHTRSFGFGTFQKTLFGEPQNLIAVAAAGSSGHHTTDRAISE